MNPTLILTTVMFCKGFCSFMRCAYEMIEYFCSVVKPYCRKIVLFFKKQKRHLNLKTFAKITWYWGPQTHPSEVLLFLPDIFDEFYCKYSSFLPWIICKEWKQQKDGAFCFLDIAGVPGLCYILSYTD